jgi:hypothetical protein
MTSLKKLLAKQQIESILSTYPVVVWYQTTQKSTKEWNKVKEKVHKIQNTLNVPNESNKVLQQYQIIQTKAALLRVVLQEKDNNPLWLSPCQGQLIVCGCSTVEAFQELLKVFDQEKEGFILGGLYDITLRTQSEMVKLQHLGPATYVALIQNLQNILARFFFLRRFCDFSYLGSPNKSLQRTILFYKDSKKQ